MDWSDSNKLLWSITVCIVQYLRRWVALLPTVGMIYSSWNYQRLLNRERHSSTDCSVRSLLKCSHVYGLV